MDINQNSRTLTNHHHNPNNNNNNPYWNVESKMMEMDHLLHLHHHHHHNLIPMSSNSSSCASPYPLNIIHQVAQTSTSSSSTIIPTTTTSFIQQELEEEEEGEEEEEREEEEEEELGAMKEMLYKIAAMQPVDIDPASIRKPKRRNVRISDDPQSVAARHRRERISEKIRILQRLVPGGTKMDTASMLDEAIRYVKFLKKQIRLLQLSHHNLNPPQTQTLSSSSSLLIPQQSTIPINALPLHNTTTANFPFLMDWPFSPTNVQHYSLGAAVTVAAPAPTTSSTLHLPPRLGFGLGSSAGGAGAYNHNHDL